MFEESLCPPGACVTCTSALVAAHEFRTLVRTSNNTWAQVVDLLDTLPMSCTPPIKSLCVFIRTDNLTLISVKDYAGGKPKAILNRLKDKMKKKPAGKDRKQRTNRSGVPCGCTDCGQSFMSPYYLNIHLRNSGQKEACLACGTVVMRGQEMKDHLANIHGETAFLCPQCPVLCTREAELKQHIKNAHKPGALTCGDCGRTFPRTGTFEAHSQMHAVRTCRACGMQFTNRVCYRRHRSQCEPEAKPDKKKVPLNRRSNIRDPATFTCDYCGKSYLSRPQLKNHIMWIHMNVRPHQCQWCAKRFYTSARLTEHKIVHTGERNFECDLCGAKLVSKMAAVYHRRRHTGERPYECEDCGEKFISSSRRSEHAKRRHGKGFRFQCSHCVLTFVRGHELRKHMEKAHNVTQNFLVDVRVQMKNMRSTEKNSNLTHAGP